MSNIDMLSEEEIAEIESSLEAQAEKAKREQKDLGEKKEFEKYAGEDRVVDSHTLKKYLDDTVGKKDTCKSGLYQLDDIVGGYEDGELVVMTGITGNGKTLLAKTLTDAFIKKKVEVLWFTYEETPETFLYRFDQDNFPKFYLPRKHTETKISWIEKRIIESKVKNQTKCVFIDHLHFLVPPNSNQNQSGVVGDVMRTLKTMALRHGIILFLLAHTKKVKQVEAPDLEHIRDSSFVSQEADKVIMIRRKGDQKKGQETIWTNQSDVFVLKNRLTGKMGSVRMEYKETTRFLEEVH